MRIPYSKVYRAFPELDRFSDSECDRFLVIARERFTASIESGRAFAILAFFVVTILCCLLWFGLGGRAMEWLVETTAPKGWRRATDFPWWYDLYIVLGVCLAPFAGGVVGLCVRDRMLIRVISRQLIAARCAGCGYSLLGLQVTAGTVTCPECGAGCVLADRGLTPADLMAEAEPSIRPGSSPNDG